MKIAQLQAASLTLSLALTTSAIGQPPDQVPHSLIPPIKESQSGARRAGRDPDVAPDKQTPPANGVGDNERPDAAASDRPTPAPYPEAPTPSDQYDEDQPPGNDYEARLAIWNSPEMVDARRYVLEFSQRSARSSLNEGKYFLEQVSRLSATDMTNWLERLQTRRAAIARQQEVASASRRFGVEKAQRVEEARQTQAVINEWQRLMDVYVQDQLQAQQLSPRELRTLRESERAAALANQRLLFDPFAPSLDPASPSRRTRAYAAATLPGDLPRGDARNFIRGEAGIDTGERSSGPNGAVAAPVPSPPPAAAASAAPSGE